MGWEVETWDMIAADVIGVQSSRAPHKVDMS